MSAAPPTATAALHTVFGRAIRRHGSCSPLVPHLSTSISRAIRTPPVYKPGPVGQPELPGRSFLSECSRLQPLAAYPRRVHRGGPPLAAYLALLQLGFTLPPALPRARWALTPPFHPCLIPRCLGGHRRCLFCGTFRHALPRAQALPGSLPCGARTFLDRWPGRWSARPRVATVRPTALIPDDDGENLTMSTRSREMTSF
jgi:hypothetical protein